MIFLFKSEIIRKINKYINIILQKVYQGEVNDIREKIKCCSVQYNANILTARLFIAISLINSKEKYRYWNIDNLINEMKKYYPNTMSNKDVVDIIERLHINRAFNKNFPEIFKAIVRTFQQEEIAVLTQEDFNMLFLINRFHATGIEDKQYTSLEINGTLQQNAHKRPINKYFVVNSETTCSDDEPGEKKPKITHDATSERAVETIFYDKNVIV